MTEWMPIGAAVDYIMKQGGQVENSRGDTLEFHLADRTFIKVDKHGKRELATLSKEVLTYNWKIVNQKEPTYVSFKEAIDAYQNGKEIESYLEGDDERFADYCIHNKNSNDQEISIGEILYGKWVIKD